MIGNQYLSSIPLSESDRLLHTWGFDLTAEYASIVNAVDTHSSVAVELATGSGRMCAVLAGMFDTVITGDRSLVDHTRALARIPEPFRHRIQYSVLDMEQLPFRDGNIPLLFCMNTLHEVASPVQCLRELIRVVHPNGTLVVGDFNKKGFDTMQRIHEIVYHNDHEEGSISSHTIEEILTSSFTSVTTLDTALNISFIASGKRSTPYF